MLFGTTRVFDKLGKRCAQLAYLGVHPLAHHKCMRAVRGARSGHRTRIGMKYLGDYLSLSLSTRQRRRALADHYQRVSAVDAARFADLPTEGIRLWQKEVGEGLPPLRINLEHARLAPMEGELQLRFSFHSDLFVLTFLFAHGQAFDSQAPTVMFIGGAQGGVACRAETREAARLNGEIAPAAMLMMAAQEIAKAVGVGEIIAISDEQHISTGYAADRIKLNYEQLWAEGGGARHGHHFRLPIDPVSKPLAETSRTHRSRTRRKRETKAQLRAAIRQGLIALTQGSRHGCFAEHPVDDQAAQSSSTHHSPTPRSTNLIPCAS